MFKVLLYQTLLNTELTVKEATTKNYKLLTLLYYKKQIYQKLFRQYKQKQQAFYNPSNSIIHIKLLSKNLFLTLCNDLNQRVITYSLGMFNAKNKLNRSSKQTMKFIFLKLKQFFKIGPTKTMTVIFKGNFKKIKKFYKFFIRQVIYYNVKIYLQVNLPHGGCRERKKRRC